jgi:acyl-CoA thioester hydrolase
MLVDSKEIKVRFNEVDSLRIVWHGHYVNYFEDGRESFGEKYGLGYLNIYDQGYSVPIVSINCNYKKSLYYGDSAIIETTFVNTPAAKIHFNFRIYNAETKELVCEGSSIQVFIDKHTNAMELSTPTFFQEWKEKHGLL